MGNLEDRTYYAGWIETAPREEIRRHQERKLREVTRWVYHHSPYWGRAFQEAGLTPDDVQTLEDLTHVPFLDKKQYMAEMEADPPYGSFLCVDPNEVERGGAVLYRTTGTTGRQAWFINSQEGFWNFGHEAARNLWLSEVRPGEYVMVTWPLSLWSAAWSYYYACREADFVFVAAGAPFDTQARLELLRDYPVKCVLLTPSYALTMAREAMETGVDLSRLHVQTLLLSGESFPESRRAKIEELWGRPGGTRDVAGITEGGPLFIGCECKFQAGLHTYEDHAVYEVLEPDGTRPVGPGEVGELVLTALNQRVMSTSYHFRTRDLVTYNDEPCECGRTHRRLSGILGRLDDMVKIRGVNVFASGVEEIIDKVSGFTDEFQLVIERVKDSDEVTVRVEAEEGTPENSFINLEETLERELQSAYQIRLPVNVLAKGTLPRTEMKARRWVDQRPKE